MNVLSLFDGMSCGQLALQKAGIPINKYYAAEIDKFAMKITKKNFANTIQLGNVINIIANTYFIPVMTSFNYINIFLPKSRRTI